MSFAEYVENYLGRKLRAMEVELLDDIEKADGRIELIDDAKKYCYAILQLYAEWKRSDY